MIATLVILSAALPVFESVTVWAALVVPTFWLANVNEVGERLAAAVDAATPEPVRLAVWGLPLALSVTVTLAVLVPDAVGLKVTLIAQVAPAATEPPQVLLWAKSPLLVPVTAMLLMLSAALPVLDSVIAWAALVVPTFWFANVSEAGARPAVAEPEEPAYS